MLQAEGRIGSEALRPKHAWHGDRRAGEPVWLGRQSGGEDAGR